MLIVFVIWFSSFITGIWPNSKLAKSFIFLHSKINKSSNYNVGIYWMCMEGLFEAGPQLVIQIVSIMQGFTTSE